MHPLHPPASRAAIQVRHVLERLAGHATGARLLVRRLLLGHGAQQRVPDVGADAAERDAEGHEDGGEHRVESWEERRWSGEVLASWNGEMWKEDTQERGAGGGECRGHGELWM